MKSPTGERSVIALAEPPEGVTAEVPNLALNISFFVPGLGITEGKRKSIVSLNPLKQFGETNDLSHALACAGGVVNHHKPWNSSDVVKDVLEPLA